MRHNNTTLTFLEIEQVREAIKKYTDEYIGPVRYIVIEGLDNQNEHYDYTAVCLIYIDGDRELYKDGLRKEGFVLGINRAEDGGFEISLD